MREVPAPTTVTVDPLIVATAVLLLEYVKAPVLLLVGAVKVNAGAPTSLFGTVKFESVGVGLVVAGLQK